LAATGHILKPTPFDQVLKTVWDDSNTFLSGYGVYVRTPGFVGHGFSRAVKHWKINAALAAGTQDGELPHTLYGLSMPLAALPKYL
jgi:hypothetical protein